MQNNQIMENTDRPPHTTSIRARVLKFFIFDFVTRLKHENKQQKEKKFFEIHFFFAGINKKKGKNVNESPTLTEFETKTKVDFDLKFNFTLWKFSACHRS
jgi:hypothetical protein